MFPIPKAGRRAMMDSLQQQNFKAQSPWAASPDYDNTMRSQHDAVEALTDSSACDLVGLLWDNPHFKFCDGEPWVNQHGTVYCGCDVDGMPRVRGCGQNIAFVGDQAEHLCPRCDCFKTCHSQDTGDCLQCGGKCGR